MKKTLKVGGMIFILAIIVAQGNQSFGQEKKQGPPTFEKLLEKMDANSDGKLAKSEVKGPLEKDFSTIDADGDGFITKTEFDKAPKPKGEKGGRK